MSLERNFAGAHLSCPATMRKYSHRGCVRSVRQWKYIQKRSRGWGRRNKTAIENTGNENGDNLLMSEGAQRKLEGVKSHNVVQKFSSEHRGHPIVEHIITFWSRKWKVSGNWRFTDWMIMSPILWGFSFPFNQGHALLGLRENENLRFDGRASTLQMSGPRTAWQGELDRMLVTVSNLFDK